jgi:hypothetical protein
MSASRIALGLGVTLLALAASGGAAGAAAPRVEVMVAGPGGGTYGPRTVTVGVARLRSEGRTCTVGRGLPLSALAWLHRAGGPGFAVTGTCDALYVPRIGPHRARGAAGWVYKVGNRLGTTGAGDASGPFGTGRRLRSGDRVLWFWCRRAGSCARTLVISATSTVAPGRRLRVRVRGFDDRGRARAAGGAVVRLGGVSARTRTDGVAVLRAPGRRGVHRITATRSGMVPAFPRPVRVR